MPLRLDSQADLTWLLDNIFYNRLNVLLSLTIDEFQKLYVGLFMNAITIHAAYADGICNDGASKIRAYLSCIMLKSINGVA